MKVCAAIRRTSRTSQRYSNYSDWRTPARRRNVSLWCATKPGRNDCYLAPRIATAEFVEILVGECPPENPLRQWLSNGPVFIKPAREDASLGISFASVTTDWAALEDQISQTHRRYGAALAERYIAGREFNVGMIELSQLTALPLAEIEFRTSSTAPWPILSYSAKWSPNSSDDLATPVRCPADVDANLVGRIQEAALTAYRLTGCRDYARVDLRVDSQGHIFVLEVNANPDLGPHAGLARMLRANHINYDEFAERLVEQAFRRNSASNSETRQSSAPCASTFENGKRSPSLSDVKIRSLREDDVPFLIDFTRASGFFRDDEIEVAEELLREALREGPSGHYQVSVAELDQQSVGWSCHGRVPLTDATWDLYWIVVAPRAQRSGIGRRLLAAVEQRVRQQSGRWLLAETSSAAAYGSTRQFYLRCGYAVLSQIDDFYRPGDGRVIFGKRIDAD